LTKTQKLNICNKNWLSPVDEGEFEELAARAVGPVAVVVEPGKARPFPGNEDLGAGIMPPGSAGGIGDSAGEKPEVFWITEVGGSITCGNWCAPAQFSCLLLEKFSPLITTFRK
jgi:hypothetical protein